MGLRDVCSTSGEERASARPEELYSYLDSETHETQEDWLSGISNNGLGHGLRQEKFYDSHVTST